MYSLFQNTKYGLEEKIWIHGSMDLLLELLELLLLLYVPYHVHTGGAKTIPYKSLTVLAYSSIQANPARSSYPRTAIARVHL